MDLATAGADQRPRALGEQLDTAFGIVRRHAVAMAGCVLVVVVPVEVVSTALTAATTDGTYDLSADVAFYDDEVAYRGGQVGVYALSGLGSVLASAAALRIALGDLAGDRVGTGASLRAAGRRAAGIAGFALLYGVLIVLLALLLVVPGVWFAVAAGLGTAALLAEGLGPWGAIRRSVQLVRGRWWTTATLLLVVFLLWGALGLAGGVLVTAIGLVDAADEPLNAALSTLAAIVVSLLVLPVLSAITAVLYVDLRVREATA